MHSPVPLRFFTQTCLGEVWRLELRRSGCYSYQCCLPPPEEEKETTGLQSKAISHKLLPSPLSSVPSGSSVMLGMRNHCPLPMGKEDLAVQLGMGSISKKPPPAPSQTGHLIQRSHISWRTYVLWRRTQGIVHRNLWDPLVPPGSMGWLEILCNTPNVIKHPSLGDRSLFLTFPLYPPKSVQRIEHRTDLPAPRNLGFHLSLCYGGYRACEEEQTE